MKNFIYLMSHKKIVLLEISRESCQMLWSNDGETIYLVFITNDGHLSVSANRKDEKKSKLLSESELKIFTDFFYEKDAPFNAKKGIFATQIYIDAEHSFFNDDYNKFYDHLKRNNKESSSIFGKSIKLAGAGL